MRLRTDKKKEVVVRNGINLLGELRLDGETESMYTYLGSYLVWSEFRRTQIHTHTHTMERIHKQTDARSVYNDCTYNVVKEKTSCQMSG